MFFDIFIFRRPLSVLDPAFLPLIISVQLFFLPNVDAAEMLDRVSPLHTHSPFNHQTIASPSLMLPNHGPCFLPFL